MFAFGHCIPSHLSDSITINNQLLLLISWNVANDEQSVWLHQFETELWYKIGCTSNIIFVYNLFYPDSIRIYYGRNSAFTNHKVAIIVQIIGTVKFHKHIENRSSKCVLILVNQLIRWIYFYDCLEILFCINHFYFVFVPLLIQTWLISM